MKQFHENISEEFLSVKGKYRDRADMLRSRLDMLSGEDKLLMTMYWENGNSLRQIGRLAGISRISLARRINKLTERLMEGKYVTCLRNRDRFTRRQMAVAKEYFLLDLSMKKIAGKRHLSYYHVRKIIQKIERILETVSSGHSGSKLTDYENKELGAEHRGTKYGDV